MRFLWGQPVLATFVVARDALPLGPLNTRLGTGSFRDHNFPALMDESGYQRPYSCIREASGNVPISEPTLWALQDAHRDMRMLVSGAGSTVSTSVFFQGTQDLLREKKREAR